VNAPIRNTALPAVTLAARFETAVYQQRNVLAALPVAIAWLAMPSQPPLAALALGAGLVLAGSGLRAWGTLYNRYAQGQRKTLATGGPYSWTRNPLYVANTLVILGGFAASGFVPAVPVAVLWCAGVYQLTIRHEERRLHEKYGVAYTAYCARVGRWLPKARGETPRISWRRFLGALAVQSRSLLILAPFLLRAALPFPG
jgi:protein-S-isoprenylcysteine O-methyltransferase Ste14